MLMPRRPATPTDALGVDVVGVVVGGGCAAGMTVNVSVWSGSVRSFAALIVTV